MKIVERDLFSSAPFGTKHARVRLDQDVKPKQKMDQSSYWGQNRSSDESLKKICHELSLNVSFCFDSAIFCVVCPNSHNSKLTLDVIMCQINLRYMLNLKMNLTHMSVFKCLTQYKVDPTVSNIFLSF